MGMKDEDEDEGRIRKDSRQGTTKTAEAEGQQVNFMNIFLLIGGGMSKMHSQTFQLKPLQTEKRQTTKKNRSVTEFEVQVATINSVQKSSKSSYPGVLLTTSNFTWNLQARPPRMVGQDFSRKTKVA